jgi:predicted nucleic acid-binding protein
VIVVDTSGLLAAIDADQRDHGAALRAFQDDPGPFLLSPFVLAELDHLLLARVSAWAEHALLEEVAGGAYELVPFDADDVAAAVAVIDRYHELSIGLADASVAVVAARARTTRLLTLDERHFRPMRPLWGEAFSLLPADGPYAGG